MSKPIINFFKGHPSRELLPTKAIASTFQKILLESDYLEYDTDPSNQHPLQYGTDPGNLDIRKILSNWLDTKYGKTGGYIDPNCINLTAGASYGVANILASVTDSCRITKLAFIVTPTYYLINGSFLDLGFDESNMVAIKETPEQEYDLDIEELERRLELESKDLESADDGREINIIEDPVRGDRKLYRFVMYLVPTFSNPGGITYSLKTRHKLIELARRYDMLIISDDVYDFLDYKEQNHPPIATFSQLDKDSLPSYKTYGNTISNATFSKILAPGLRVGWQHTPTSKLVSQLAITGANKSGGTPAQLSTFVVGEMIKSGKADEIIEDFKRVYKKRARVVIESIGKYLPKSTKVYGGDGGYFFWIILPEIEDHSLIVKELQRDHNVILAGGENFEVAGDSQDWGKCCVRLSISFLSEEEIEEGIKIWGSVIRKHYGDLY
ncbi:YEY2 [[Candida] subhashii]|uniref:YEY2 n=1 Tax=[Candida] subhashii TaxID=561895 RepID=A0A8J5V0V5_9ASCO|nr:YEY2 [[Candida] subhashii]KAG7665615.1 YEY2 [[Candida] subhashii]